MEVKSYKDLRVWRMGLELVDEIYDICSKLPQIEVFGLANQMRRASVSIPSNIAEGSKRTSRADFRQFCLIALGSSAELETQLLIVRKHYPNVNVDKAVGSVADIQKMLTSLGNKLKTINGQR